MRLSMTIVLFAFVFGVVALSLTGTAFAHEEAADWIRELRNGENGGCCGEDDCIPVDSIEVTETGETTMRILINGVISTQIRRTSFVPVSCDKRPHACLNKRIAQDGKIIACWWVNADGTLGIFPSPRCWQCAVVQQCPASS